MKDVQVCTELLSARPNILCQVKGRTARHGETIINAKDSVLQELEHVEALWWVGHLHNEINFHQLL